MLQEGEAGASASGAEVRKSTSARWWIAGGVVLLIAIVLWNWLGHKKTDHKKLAQVVSVAQAVQGDMPVLLNEIGTVTPTATVTVLPNQNVSGYLIKIGFREGQWVNKGALLAEIDPRPYEVQKNQAEAALARDQAALAAARYDLSLYEKLYSQQAIAVQTYKDQRFTVQQQMAAVAADRAAVEQYALDITYCHITAPVSGQTGLRLVDVGNYITGGSSSGIVTLTTTRPMLVQFGVAQNDIAQLAARFGTPGVKLPVTALDSSTNQPLATGSLYAIGNQMNTSTGQTLMRASFANTDGKLWPNAFVNVRVEVNTLHHVVIVPTSAVLMGAPGTYVYVVGQNHKVSVRKITAGASDGIHTAILAGLSAGERVVTDGTDRLTEGAAIRIARDQGSDPNPKNAAERAENKPGQRGSRQGA